MSLLRMTPKLTALAVLLAPWAAFACPRCVDATPYKTGMLIAVLVLLPIPLVLGFSLYRWIRKAEEGL
jgi:hypothetical protein